MKRTSILGLCLAAVCAIFAVTATASLAVFTPGGLEYGQCKKVAEGAGPWKNGGCTVLGKEKVEETHVWVPLAKVVNIESNKLEGSPAPSLTSSSGVVIACETQKSPPTGEVGPGPKQQKNIVGEFTKCKAAGLGECGNVTKENINTTKLSGGPGVITKVAGNAKNKEGADLVAEGLTEGEKLLASFICGVVPIKVRGGVVVAVPVNKMLNKSTVKFVTKTGENFRQVPEEWTPVSRYEKGETPVKEFLEAKTTAGGEYEQSGQVLETVQKTVPKSVKVELRQCKDGVC